MTAQPRVWTTERLRLVPIGLARAEDLWLVHADADVAHWYQWWPTRPEIDLWATEIETAWRTYGFHKWLAYERASGEVVGRGGVAPVPIDDDWGQIRRFLPAESWVDDPHPVTAGGRVHACWVEIGWALRRSFWGHGLAAEIGRAGLDFALGDLGMHAVVSCTPLHNYRSRTVMDRIGMPYAGEILTRGPIKGLDGNHDNAAHAVHVLRQSPDQRHRGPR